MKSYLSSILAAVLLTGLAAVPARAALTTEGLKAYVKRVGARVDEAKGNLLVTSMARGRGRVQLRLLNDVAKNRLGFYAYGFGNVASSKDRAELYEYLLRSNSDLAIGSFFVDEDRDVGYKFFLSTRDAVSYATFETAYLAMVNVIAERGPRIMRLASGGAEAAPEPAQPAVEPTAPEEPAGTEAAPADKVPASDPPVETPPADEPPRAAAGTRRGSGRPDGATLPG